MITEFEKYINEKYDSSKRPNNVPFSTLGFRYSEPSKPFEFHFLIKDNPKIKDILNNLFDKYNIKTKDIKVIKLSNKEIDDKDILSIVMSGAPKNINEDDPRIYIHTQQLKKELISNKDIKKVSFTFYADSENDARSVEQKIMDDLVDNGIEIHDILIGGTPIDLPKRKTIKGFSL
ncbi:hypothetical protein M0Q50_01205 [bacterium]|jgi:hypothetical protein|nr:hypothetical protein [bacterium]